MRIYKCDKCGKTKNDWMQKDPIPIKCNNCDGDYIEVDNKGNEVFREPIGDQTIEDITKTEKENFDLINAFIAWGERMLQAKTEMQKNFDKRQNLQRRLENIINLGMKKQKLFKDKSIKWGYDPFNKDFVGMREVKK